MSGRLVVLLTALLLASSLPVSPVSAAGPWSLDKNTERVALEFRTDDLASDEVQFTIEDRTGLALLVGETPAAILEALGLRTGYSQVATWQARDGPVIACPALGSNVWCSSDAGAGLALVPNPGRAMLLARAPDAPGQADLTVMVGDVSLAFDLAVVSVGLGLSLVAPDVRAVPSDLVVDLAIRILPEAITAAEAVVSGDITAATRSLAAAGWAAAMILMDHALELGAALGIAIATNLVPHIAVVKLMLAAAKAVPPILTLAYALGDSERTTVRVGWDGETPRSTSRLSVSAAGDHFCALLDGDVWCWGIGADGELGDGEYGWTAGPVMALGLESAVAVSAGDGSEGGHTCAVADARAWCWGSNRAGQVAAGGNESVGVPHVVEGLDQVTAISAGGSHTCAIARERAWCWGLNNAGQLGDGSVVNKNVPVQVRGLEGVTEISAGADRTCAIAADGAWCWGYGRDGQLGNGSTVNSTLPVRVKGMGRASAISTVGYHTCAVAEGSAWCWGDNHNGQLGDGSTTSSAVPVEVAGLKGVSSITTGAYHTCAIAEGSPWCWGWNSAAQLGNGSTADAIEPTRVTAVDGIDALYAGWASTCAVANAQVWCWYLAQTGDVGPYLISIPSEDAGSGVATGQPAEGTYSRYAACRPFPYMSITPVSDTLVAEFGAIDTVLVQSIAAGALEWVVGFAAGPPRPREMAKVLARAGLGQWETGYLDIEGRRYLRIYGPDAPPGSSIPGSWGVAYWARPNTTALRGDYQLVTAPGAPITPSVVEATCSMMTDRLMAEGIDIAAVQTSGTDEISVYVWSLDDEASFRAMMYQGPWPREVREVGFQSVSTDIRE